jgi:hypothetical protein
MDLFEVRGCQFDDLAVAILGVDTARTLFLSGRPRSHGSV